ncbi:MAG: hypothetical protein ACREP9_06990 [Candidatus Dormibacteraceae bacterium]
MLTRYDEATEHYQKTRLIHRQVGARREEAECPSVPLTVSMAARDTGPTTDACEGLWS